MLSGHQATDTLNLALYMKNMIKENDDRLWISNVAPVACWFQNKVMFLLKIMLIHDQLQLSGHLPVTTGRSLVGGSTVAWCHMIQF